jgi:hypothetical protein
VSLIIKPDGSSFQRPHQSRAAWRRLEKRPRETARAKAWRPAPGTRLTEANLSLYEAELGLVAVAVERGFQIGRILDYDQRRNVFTVVGTMMRTRKPIEARVAGWRVSQPVIAARLIAGVDQLRPGADV